jgi:hypothetical protein
MAPRMPAAPDPALDAEWSRVLTYSAKLFESPDRLGELGGTCRIAAANRWTGPDQDRAMAQLLAAREAVDAELEALALRRRHYPRARRLG